jgi:citrate synthase
MAHPVEEIIRRASAEDWCSEPYCTTCGCMQFRTAIRDLPREVVDEFLRGQPDPDVAGLPNYNRYLHLILFHQLPQTQEEQAEARAQARRAFEEMERRDAQSRAAAREQRLVRLAEKRRIAAEKHRRRQVEKCTPEAISR